MLPELIREALSVVALVGYVIWLNPMLSFYAFVVLPIVIYPLIRIAKRLKKLSKRSQEKSADVMTRLSEIFNNSEIIKANATEKFELKKFEVENQHFLKLTMKAVYTGEVVSPMLEIIGATGLAAVIFFGAQEVYTDKMTVGEFFSFFTAVGLALQPLRRIGSIYGKIQDAVAASERVFELMDKQLNIIDGTQELTQTIQNIEFKKVALNYNNKPALENINLTISSGKTIALVGDSGGGKSSLINLLIRFYDVSSGNLEINHHDIKSFTQKSLREHIAIVSQRVYIFNDTLAANVAYGHEINEEKVLHALKLANATEFVQSLYEGMHTMMEEFGSNLSGGQRQRIAIARAIYKDASVLILDEATSALDNRSEKEIQNALEEFAKNKITIIIAHRLSTIEHADEILVFKSGEIVDRGSHIELTQSSKAYQKLLQGLE
jgi:subfamily B ATP-binding cassette protein MsbA